MANFFKNYKKNKELKLTQEEIDAIMNNINRNKGEDHSDHPEWTKKDVSGNISFIYDNEYGWVPDEQ